VIALEQQRPGGSFGDVERAAGSSRYLPVADDVVPFSSYVSSLQHKPSELVRQMCRFSRGGTSPRRQRSAASGGYPACHSALSFAKTVSRLTLTESVLLKDSDGRVGR
jgi:hypothetical protein